MADERTLLDTDIYSELMRGKNAVIRARAESYLKEHGRFTISVITVLEIAKGLRKAQRDDALTRFTASLGALEIIDMGREAALMAGRIYGDLEKSGQPIGRADPMIAAIALASGLVLATGNAAHYERIVAIGYPLRQRNWRVTNEVTDP